MEHLNGNEPETNTQRVVREATDTALESVHHQDEALIPMPWRWRIGIFLMGLVLATNSVLIARLEINATTDKACQTQLRSAVVAAVTLNTQITDEYVNNTNDIVIKYGEITKAQHQAILDHYNKERVNAASVNAALFSQPC